MIYRYQNLKTLQLEISSNCNAACPQCPRNYYGGPVIDELPLINWSLLDMQDILKPELIQQLDRIYFCGTYGDPMFNKNIVSMCQWLKDVNPDIKIGIHTNGSLGKKENFQKLAKLAEFVAFGIDGLADTNYLYRRNTDWHTIMKNARLFIASGGTAYWDYIVFEHNQHQVEAARQLSIEMGFREFNIKKTARFFNKEHKLVSSIDVFDNKIRKVYEIKLPSDSRYLNQNYKIVESIDKKSYTEQANIRCHYLKSNEIYIGADGYVFPCGWLHDRLYGIESANTPDRQQLYDMMERSGGKESANCFHSTLETIINGAWFKNIQDSWTNKKLERCAMMCGGHFNLIKEQNESIQYI